MPFVKGKPKTGGRQKGSVNHDKKTVVDKINQLWEGYSAEQMQLDLQELKGRERLNIMLGLAAEFCAPKLARTDLNLGNKEGEQLSVNIKIVDSGNKD